jgi:hypothetical protein
VKSFDLKIEPGGGVKVLNHPVDKNKSFRQFITNFYFINSFKLL